MTSDCLASLAIARTDHFPPDFRWGISTAFYQIEGAVKKEGRGGQHLGHLQSSAWTHRGERYPVPRRIPKLSIEWYKKTIWSGRVS